MEGDVPLQDHDAPASQERVRRDNGQTEWGDAIDQGPLVSEEIEAGARFVAAFGRYAPVQAAFWLKESETGHWGLYVVSDQITDDNFDVGYGEAMRIANALKDPWFDPFQVHLIGSDDPLAKAAVDVQRRSRGRTAIRLNGEGVGGASVDELYFYPLPISVPVR